MKKHQMTIRYRKLSNGTYSLYHNGRRIGSDLRWLSDCEIYATAFANGKTYVLWPAK
jgi:hypothetical protein